MCICLARNGAVKLVGSKLYFAIILHVRYDMHSMYVCIRKYRASKGVIWVNIICAIINSFWYINLNMFLNRVVMRNCGGRW